MRGLVMTGVLTVAAFLGTLPVFVAPGGAPPKPMDLVWATLDANGLPLNPDWSGQSGRPHADGSDIDASAACDRFHNHGRTLRDDRCTSQQPTVDQRLPLRGVLPDLVAYACNFYIDEREELDRDSVHGHVNWTEATYSGDLSFDDYQDPRLSLKNLPPLDGDLDFTLVRQDHAGYVKGNNFLDDPGITLEANRHELGDLNTPWWSRFRDSFESHPKHPDARGSLRDARAVAIGLLGIDTKHGAHTELHPLYALLARSAKNATTEHWVFFARNSGYEGACSRDEHVLGKDAITIAIESALGSPVAGNVAVSPPSARTWLTFGPGSIATMLTVRFPANVRRPVIVGEFDLCKSACSVATSRASFEPTRLRRREGSARRR